MTGWYSATPPVLNGDFLTIIWGRKEYEKNGWRKKQRSMLK